jgi:competence protein ComEA
MIRSPLTRNEIAVLLGLALILLGVAAAAALRRHFAVPPVSVVFAPGSGSPYRMNLNTASAEELTLLRGIGMVKARGIVNYRQEHGPFKSLDDLRNVPGITPKLIGGMSDFVTVAPQEDPGERGGDVPRVPVGEGE